MFKADGEPPLSELLADPILHLLMERDGISLSELERVIESARRRRNLDPATPRPRAGAGLRFKSNTDSSKGSGRHSPSCPPASHCGIVLAYRAAGEGEFRTDLGSTRRPRA